MSGNITGFLGLKSTGDFVTDEMPGNWREFTQRIQPNGDAPMTAMTSLMRQERSTSPEENWWDKTTPAQRASTINSGVYDDAGLNTAYTSGGVLGTTVYVNVAAADMLQFRQGQQIQLRKSTDYRHDTTGKLVSLNINGTASYVAVELREAADATYDLDDVDTVTIMGNINPEGGNTPTSLLYQPTKYTNKHQIFRTALDLTRTALRTHVRTGDVYKEAKLDTLELHQIEMEKAIFFSVLSEVVGDNNKPERTMLGIVPAIQTYAPDNVKDFTFDTDYSGDTWIQSGEEFLDKMFEQIFRFGKDEKLAWCGSGAMLGIARLAKTYGHINLTPTSNAYGIKTMLWTTPFGDVHLKRHPLFSYEPTNRNSMVVIEPSRFEYMYIDDTFYKKDKTMREGGQVGTDGILEEFVTEMCLRYSFMSTGGYLNGVGLDSTL